MTLCGVHDNMHVHTTVAHTCDYPLYLYRHSTLHKVWVSHIIKLLSTSANIT